MLCTFKFFIISFLVTGVRLPFNPLPPGLVKLLTPLEPGDIVEMAEKFSRLSILDFHYRIEFKIVYERSNFKDMTYLQDSHFVSDLLRKNPGGINHCAYFWHNQPSWGNSAYTTTFFNVCYNTKFNKLFHETKCKYRLFLLIF